MHQGGFACAGAAQNAHGLPRLHGEGDIPQHRAAVLVAEVHMVKLHLAFQRRAEGFAGFGLGRGGQNLVQSAQRDVSHHQIGQNTAQLPHGEGEHAGVAGEQNHVAHRHGAPGGHEHAHHQHQGDLGVAHHVGQAPVEGHEGVQLAADGPVFGVEPGVFFQLLFLPGKGPHHPHAGEVFLQSGGEPAVGFVHQSEVFLYPLRIKEGEQDQHRQQTGGHGGEGAADGQHDGDGDEGHHHGAQHLDQLHLHKAPHHSTSAVHRCTRSPVELALCQA